MPKNITHKPQMTPMQGAILLPCETGKQIFHEPPIALITSTTLLYLYL